MRSLILNRPNDIKKWLTNGSEKVPLGVANLLWQAVVRGRTKICQVIVDNAEIEDIHMSQALRYACGNRHWKILKILIKRIDVTNRSLMDPVLLAISVQGHIDFLIWVMDKMKLPQKDRNDWLLANASGLGDLDVINHIIGKSNIEFANYNRAINDALRIASYRGKSFIVAQLLLNERVDLGSSGVIRTWHGHMTPLIAASYRFHKDVIKMLLDEPNISRTINATMGETKSTALHLIIWSQKGGGFTKLHAACAAGDLQLAEKLLYICECGSSSNQEDSTKCECLLNKINSQDNDGHTPLHSVCVQGHLEMLKLLRSTFCDNTITNNWGHTALYIAEQFGNSHLIPILKGKDFEEQASKAYTRNLSLSS